jgi:hypothetical protein
LLRRKKTRICCFNNLGADHKSASHDTETAHPAREDRGPGASREQRVSQWQWRLQEQTMGVDGRIYLQLDRMEAPNTNTSLERTTLL